MQAGHIHPTASERQRPVSASISSLSGNVRNDRPGPLRRQTWQMTHSEFMVRHRTEHRSRRGLGKGAGRLHHTHGPQSAFQPWDTRRTSNEGRNGDIWRIFNG